MTTGVPPHVAEVCETRYVELTRVPDRAAKCSLENERVTSPMSLEAYVSEQLASGEGTPEFRAWVARIAARMGLG